VVGVSNLETFIASIPPYWQSFFENLARRIGDPRTEAGRAHLRARSPLNRASAIAKPLLILQGANDPRVKQAESDQIVAAAKARGLPVTYALYPDEGHGFIRPANSISSYAIVEAFLAQHLAGTGGSTRFEPIGADLQGASLTVDGAQHVPGLEAALKARRWLPAQGQRPLHRALGRLAGPRDRLQGRGKEQAHYRPATLRAVDPYVAAALLHKPEHLAEAKAAPVAPGREEWL
jgi:hypothetical protein